MPIVLTIGRHLAESCPEFNEKTRKIFLEYMSKREELLKKHGVKEIGALADIKPSWCSKHRVQTL